MPIPDFELLAISDRRGMNDGFGEWVAALGAAGVGALQIREKDLVDRELYGLARLARAVLPRSTAVLVNGRIDVALAAGAQGVHLPADGLPVEVVRRRFGPGVLLGRSTHSVAEVERAREEGADYVVFGPVYAVPGKERFGPPLGVEALRQASGRGIPVYALGGVTLGRLGEVAATGAAGVAGIRMFQQAGELPALVRAAREAFRGLRPGDRSS